MTTYRTRGSRAALLALLLSVSSVALLQRAYAQDAAASQDSSPGTTDTIETVTVVARKRAEDNQQVPIPVSVISAGELDQKNYRLSPFISPIRSSSTLASEASAIMVSTPMASMVQLAFSLMASIADVRVW
jgi:outer membrane receptor protein involved in Fe transport